MLTCPQTQSAYDGVQRGGMELPAMQDSTTVSGVYAPEMSGEGAASSSRLHEASLSVVEGMEDG